MTTKIIEDNFITFALKLHIYISEVEAVFQELVN